MGIRKAIAAITSILLILGMAPAKAADPVADRAAQVTLIQTKYVKVLDEQRLTLLALKNQMKVDPSLLKQVNSVIADFDSNYGAIIKGLEDPNQPIQPIIDLCEEEVEEFGNSIYQLQQMIKNLKSIKCIKGKVTKTVTALTPVCPKGFTKKKK